MQRRAKTNEDVLMKYILLIKTFDYYYDTVFILTDSLPEVFEYLKDKDRYESVKAYKLGGEITSMEDAVKKEV